MCARLFRVCSLFLCAIVCTGDVDAQTAADPNATGGGTTAASTPASGTPTWSATPPATAPATDSPLITIPAGVDPYVFLGVIIEDFGGELSTVNSQERYLYSAAEASKDSGQKKALLEKWARARMRQHLLSRIVNDARKQRRELLRVDEIVAGASAKILLETERE